MLDKSRKVCFSFEEILSVTREIETVFVSLHRQGSYFFPDGVDHATDEMWRVYEKETTRYIDEGRVTGRLSRVCIQLYSRLEAMLNEEERDALEKEMEADAARFWKKPGDN